MRRKSNDTTPCPHCRSRKPKTLILGPARLNVAPWLALSVLTCGACLPLFPLFRTRGEALACERCGCCFDR